METSSIEGYESLQERLATHKKLLKEVDSSIKRLSGSDKHRNGKNQAEMTAEKMNKNSRIVSAMGLTPRMTSASIDNNLDRMASDKLSVTVQSHGSDRSLKRKSYEPDHRHSMNGSHNNKRTSSGANDHGNNSRHADHESDPDDDFERPQIKSSVVSSAMPIKTKEDLIKIQNKGANVQRNKRIFGHLLGTLSQFKSDDKARSATSQAIHRKELEAKIEINKVEEIKRLAAEKKKLEEDKARHSQMVELLESKMQLTQDLEIWKSNQMRYKKFIRTKTKPYIYYLPKQMNEQTTRLVKETAALIDEQIAKRVKETTGELEALKRKEAQLNKNHPEAASGEEPSKDGNENKENKQGHKEESSKQSNEMMIADDLMDEEKLSVNDVQLGEDDDEPEDEESLPNSNSEMTSSDMKSETTNETNKDALSQSVQDKTPDISINVSQAKLDTSVTDSDTLNDSKSMQD